MKSTVFGASGGIGQWVVTLAGQRGHDVRATYRTAPDVPPGGPVEVLVNPDILEPGSVPHAVADVVITAAGSNFATRHNPGSSRFTMTTDVAWYLLERAEQPTPAHRTPVITSGQPHVRAAEAQRTIDLVEKS